jgi:hypothetical protein
MLPLILGGVLVGSVAPVLTWTVTDGYAYFDVIHDM